MRGPRLRSCKAAFHILGGRPDAESNIDGQRVFTWGSRERGSNVISAAAYGNSERICSHSQVAVTRSNRSLQHYEIVGSSGTVEGTKYYGSIDSGDRHASLLGD